MKGVNVEIKARCAGRSAGLMPRFSELQMET
jgi:hypothetical protein